MSDYRATIGLEIHAELATETKMFCACKNDANEKKPNTNICPVCMAHPGSLPVINKDALQKVLLVGAALDCEFADYSEFDRKNYFYPDIPKGYQISQYAYPLLTGGRLGGVSITRIHLEEDTARSQHQGEESLVDYNRSGVPLMELVTDPVIHSAEEASSFARELQLLLQYLGSAEANMEKGEMRVEANISVSKDETLGTKTEVKNLNSFRSVERAVAYEIKRQTELLERGEKVLQETRGWDEQGQKTFSQRIKESSEDYRYFPEPDLPKLMLSEMEGFSKIFLVKELPVLPWERRRLYKEELGLKIEDAEMLCREPLLADFFDSARKGASLEATTLIANYLITDLVGKKEAGLIDIDWFNQPNAIRLANLIELIQQGKLSSRGAKDILVFMATSPDSPEVILEREGLGQKSDGAFLAGVVAGIIEAHPSVVADYRSGKDAALQFLVGQGMKESKGSANPQILKEAFKKALN